MTQKEYIDKKRLNTKYHIKYPFLKIMYEKLSKMIIILKINQGILSSTFRDECREGRLKTEVIRILENYATFYQIKL